MISTAPDQSRPSRPSVLAVDDTPANLKLLHEALRDTYVLLTATSGQRALDICRSDDRPDVVLLDVVMPGMDGYAVCRALKEDPRTRDIPVIFITSRNDAEDEEHGLMLGAADYIPKPFSLAIVRMRVRNQVELLRAKSQLARLAATDGLTGLANRRCFDEKLAMEFARHTRSDAALGILLIDIDHFKRFNDSYGHLAGDDCLRKVAGVLDGAANRAFDLAARYGGEEFVCVLPETDRDGAIAIAEIIRRGIHDLDIPHRESITADRVTASIGVVAAQCTLEMTELHLLERVDKQLYAAKAGGRNRVVAEE